VLNPGLGEALRDLRSKKTRLLPRLSFSDCHLFFVTGTAARATRKATFLASGLTTFRALLGAVAAV
jgi:hypothetical protein